MRALHVVGLFLCLLGLLGCQKSGEGSAETTKKSAPENDAAAFLKWSMDRHSALKSYSAKTEWSFATGGPGEAGMKATRTLDYVKPNVFRLVSDGPAKMVSQSDGKEHVEYSSGIKQGLKYPAPISIGAANTMQMDHFMFNGSLIYRFFEGSAGYDDLVDESKTEPTFGSNAKDADGVEWREVRFASKGNYGNVIAKIDVKTGLVLEMTYDLAPLASMISEGRADAKYSASEKFKEVKTDHTIPADRLAQPIPSDIDFEALANTEGGPVAAFKPGDLAPDITFQTLEGAKSKLSDFRGSVVLIDFWATWCGPCIEGLPITDKIHREFGSKGLKVVAISDEDAATIGSFVKEKGFAFTAYRDSDGSANKAFKIQGIPTIVLVGKDGKVLSYTVGLEPEAELRSRLPSHGIK